MFEPNPNLVERLSPPLRPLSTEFIDGWANQLYTQLDLTGSRRQAIANYVEAVGRLVLKSDQLSNAVGFFITPTFISSPQPASQHEIYDLYEGYFQSLYKTLSSLAAVTVVFQDVFESLPTRSMKRFLGAVSDRFPTTQQACSLLEHARQYRTLLDHPAGAAVSNWMSFRNEDGRGLRIIFYGNRSNSGGFPEGAEPVTFPFPTQADWIFDVPFVPYTNQALRDLTDALFDALAPGHRN
jgi:hypothetical protein